jgi:hypothetical protein
MRRRFCRGCLKGSCGLGRFGRGGGGNDRFQIDDARFAEMLWSTTALKELVTTRFEEDESLGLRVLLLVVARRGMRRRFCRGCLKGSCGLGRFGKDEALRVNDRFQIDDARFAEMLWSTTALKELVTTSFFGAPGVVVSGSEARNEA